jgi:hypothetical protein
MHYSPYGIGDVLNTVVYQIIQLSEVTAADILDSDHLPTVFSILDPVRQGKLYIQLKNCRLGAVS